MTIGNAYGFGGKGEWRSISDLIDIVAAKDVDMRNLARSINEVASKPNHPDLSAFNVSYAFLVTRYNAARAIAQKAIDDASSVFNPLPKAVNTATDEYEGLLNALNPRWGENTWAPGDGSYEDLLDQITKMGATGKGNEPTPQPKTVDALQLANAAASVVEGGVEGLGTAAGKGSKALMSNLDWSTVIKIGAIVGVGLIILPKVLAFTPARILR